MKPPILRQLRMESSQQMSSLPQRHDRPWVRRVRVVFVYWLAGEEGGGDARDDLDGRGGERWEEGEDDGGADEDAVEGAGGFAETFDFEVGFEGFDLHY